MADTPLPLVAKRELPAITFHITPSTLEEPNARKGRNFSDMRGGERRQ